MLNTKTLLIVDDDIHFQTLTQRLIGQMGHTVLIASTGSEALRILYTNQIDVLLLDLNLGNGISGWDILYITHNDDKLKDIPIAIISNTAEEQLDAYFQKAQQPSGSLKFSPRITMTKPINRQDLLRFIALVETESKK